MENNKQAPIYIVSGGKGLTGNNLVQSLLIQYPDNNVPVIMVPDVTDNERLEAVVLQAKNDGGMITHTMVNRQLRERLLELTGIHGVKQVDFMGELSDYLDKTLGIAPLEVPGLFREINQQYFDRIDAIEFTLNHDDGLDPTRLREADVVLCGVSRSGKTPLSVYLAMYGWKVANVPLVKGIDPPAELFAIDPMRVFGLQISIRQLIVHRLKRLRNIGAHRNDDYTDVMSVRADLLYAETIFTKGRFSVIDVTNKPVESTANEIFSLLTSRFNYGNRHL